MVGLIAEAEENAVISLGADHDLIGRRKVSSPAFFSSFFNSSRCSGELKNSAAACASRIHS